MIKRKVKIIKPITELTMFGSVLILLVVLAQIINMGYHGVGTFPIRIAIYGGATAYMIWRNLG